MQKPNNPIFSQPRKAIKKMMRKTSVVYKRPKCDFSAYNSTEMKKVVNILKCINICGEERLC